MRREPSVLLTGLIAPVVYAITALFVTNQPEVSGAINAVAVALAGAVTAWTVRSDKQLPAIVGLVQAVLILVTALGLALSPEQQAAIMTPLSLIAAFVVRDRVVAPEPTPPHVVDHA